VFIHPFPSGNGRHARLTADVLLHNHDLPRLDWGGVTGQGDPRTRYSQALRAADDGDFHPLLQYLNLAG
jgi:fido (protein-threonine AMPylation protein)